MTIGTLDRDPAWVPDSVRTYLAHVVEGQSIRSIARRTGCHASTVLRQVRRCEQRRDDPLIDHALRRLSRARTAGTTKMKHTNGQDWRHDDEVMGEAQRVLRRLAERGACLAVAQGMETAIIVRQGADGNTLRTGSVDVSLAETLALREWISASEGGRVTRYRITGQGRVALAGLQAHDEQARARREAEEEEPAHRRYGSTESPLLMLARRRDRDGNRFLTAEMVRSGERLREEYEVAAMGPAPVDGWDSLMVNGPAGPIDAGGPDGARARLAAALSDLGPGLGDVVLRVCCQLEGLETVEKRMGWAARSSKIVLRIGLDRLTRHFESCGAAGGGLIW